VTHEVRNPLSSIGLNAELLDQLLGDAGLDRAAADEAQTLSRAIGREVDRLTAITEDYLRFARLPRPELEPGDPGLLVASLATFVRADLAAHHVDLVVERPEHAPPGDLARDPLRQVVLNLVRNGREAMPTGGTLTLAVEPEAGPDGDGCVIAVRDTGVGISAADRERIFDPFFSTKLTGTGLGLALVHQIVHEHGGHIAVRSAPGAGTEFRIWLPARRKDGVSSAAPSGAPALLEDDV
jgi:signal transduction histidine kinase